MSNFINKEGCDLIGPTGPTGHSIVSATVSTVPVGDPVVNEQHLVFTSSSGATFDVGKATGATGADGEIGAGFSSAAVQTAATPTATKGHLIVTKTDGSTFDAGSVAGADGVSITDASIDGVSTSTTYGHLIMTSTGGATLDAGLAKGVDGQDGADSTTVIELQVFS